MALSDSQITAKNFRDFYDTIFPYLSGAVHAGYTPVGTIINVIGTTAPANYLKCDGATYSITAYLPLATYIKNQFGSYNHFGGDGVTTFAVPTKAGGTDDIYCIAVRDLNIDLSANYSEDEQVIGTWLDTPLYQKTFNFTTPITAGQASVLTIPNAYIRNIIGGWVYWNDDNDNEFVPLCTWYANSTYFISCKVINKNELYVTTNEYTNKRGIVTLQYTKTTD